MKAIGTVIVEVGDDSGLREVKSDLDTAMTATLAGRFMSVVIPLADSWRVSPATEAHVTRYVLGAPSSRTPNDKWMFSGNVATRICLRDGSTRRIASERLVLLFRKAGPKPYERRSDVSVATYESSSIPVGHPAFTRDVANNVWHLPVRGHKTELRRRISMLLSWSDELTLVVASGICRHLRYKQPEMDSTLIGVPRKVPYLWRPEFDVASTDCQV